MNIKKWILENWLSKVLTLLVIFVGSFMGYYCARSLPIKNETTHKIDTVYIKRSITDSLLLEISLQLHDIEKKLQPQKVYIQKKHSIPIETLKIDASIHINQKINGK